MVKILIDAGMSAFNAIDYINSVYGEKSVKRSTVYNWFKYFSDRDFELKDINEKGN